MAAFAVAHPATAQVLENKLTAFDGGQADELGYSVAMIPGWAFCGAPGDDDAMSDSGAVYVFKDPGLGTGWSFALKLKASPPVAAAAHGFAVAAAGGWMLATAPFDTPTGPFVAGSANLYRFQGGTWVHALKLVPSDAATTAFHFGGSCAMTETRIAIGAPEDLTFGTTAGSAYVYEISGTTWVEVAKVYSPDAGSQDHFGQAVAIDFDTLAVGAPEEDNGVPGSNQGAVYVFARTGPSVWTFQQKLVASDPHADDDFGRSLALEGDRLLVGSQHDHALTDDGAMYVFERSGGAWSQAAELLAVDSAAGSALGESVDLQNDLALGSAPSDSDHGSISGSAYIFRRNANGSWLQIAKALAPDAQQQNQFGSAVALVGDKLLIGARSDDWTCPGSPLTCNAGSAYVFQFARDAVQYGSCPTQGPCGNHDDFGGCRTSSGNGGELAAAGSASVAEDDLQLEARWLPANKLGILFMGGLATSAPFADGQICVAPGSAGIWRFNPAQSSGAQGALKLGPGVVGLSNSLPAGGHISPGQIWHFQAWFRDPAGPCGQGSNMTNAVRVVFEP